MKIANAKYNLKKESKLLKLKDTEITPPKKITACANKQLFFLLSTDETIEVL